MDKNMKSLHVLMLFCLISCAQPAVQQKTVEVPIPQLPIEEPPPVEPGVPGFLRFDEQEQYTDRDIKTLNASERPDTRYLIGCNFLNQGISDLSDQKAGVNKGINMISTQRLITQVDTIDDPGCIWRISLSAIGMTREEWQNFERANVLPFISETVRGRTLRALTNTNQPMVYASSFFLTVMQADQVSIGNQLYYNLTEQPLNDAEFIAGLGINLQNEFNNQEPACAGGGRSQIALGKPRLICIMDTTRDGFLMFTADVSLARNDSIKLNPFTAEMAAIPGFATNRQFKFVAREWIFSMPNGLLTGYRLSNAGGSAEVIAPAQVVIDVDQAGEGLPADITLGACSNCHHQEAAMAFNDEVFNNVQLDGNASPSEKKLAEVFYKKERFNALRSIANQNHTRALKEIGVSTLKEDPLVSNIIQPLRKPLNAAQIAGYLSMTEDDFKIRLNGTNVSKVLFSSLIDGGVVPLQDFVNGFGALKTELLLFQDAGQL
jgi:hypothetical protein